MNDGNELKTRAVKSVSNANMNGPKNINANATTRILGINVSVGS